MDSPSAPHLRFGGCISSTSIRAGIHIAVGGMRALFGNLRVTWHSNYHPQCQILRAMEGGVQFLFSFGEASHVKLWMT